MKTMILFAMALLISVPAFAQTDLLFQNGDPIIGATYYPEKDMYAADYAGAPVIDLSQVLVQRHRWVAIRCEINMSHGEPHWKSYEAVWELTDKMVTDNPYITWGDVLPDKAIPFPDGVLAMRGVLVFAENRGPGVDVLPSSVTRAKSQWQQQ